MRILDLFCGRGGWSKPFLRAGHECIGVDIVDHNYPGTLIQTDIMHLDPATLGHIDFILASPPCEEFSRHDQPWTRKRNPPPPNLKLWCRTVEIAQLTHAPLIIENVRGAIKWIGPHQIRYGKSTYLWGHTPAVLEQPGRNHTTKGTRKQKRKAHGDRAATRAEIPRKLANQIYQHVIMTIQRQFKAPNLHPNIR